MKHVRNMFTPLIFALFIINILYGYVLKRHFDVITANTTVIENLLRQNIISVEDLPDNAPFGYLGWKFFNYFIHNEGKHYTGLCGFLNYLNRKTHIYSTSPLNIFKEQLDPHQIIGSKILSEGAYSCGYLTKRYLLITSHFINNKINSFTALPFKINNLNFKQNIFPLNNNEWKKYISAAEKSGSYIVDSF